MSENSQQKLSNVETDAAKSRRKFIKRGSAGVLLASLPAASVWGQDNLIAGSIAASGHGSDFAGGQPIALLSPGYWQNHPNHWNGYDPTTKFSVAFGGSPFGPVKKDGDVLNSGERNDLSLMEILKNPGGGQNGLGGPENVNCFLIMILLCAASHGQSMSGQMVNFPVIRGSENSQGQPVRGLFNDLPQFAQYLYDKAMPNPGAMGAELSVLLNTNHA